MVSTAEATTPVLEKLSPQQDKIPTKEVVDLAKDVGRGAAVTAMAEGQEKSNSSKPDSKDQALIPTTEDAVLAAQEFLDRSNAERPVIEQKLVLPETDEERLLAKDMIKRGLTDARKIGAVLNFRRGLIDQHDPRTIALVNGMISIYLGEAAHKKEADLPTMAGGSGEAYPQEKDNFPKKESLNRLFDTNLKIAFVAEEDLQHIIDRARSLKGRRIGLDVTPVQLDELAKGRVPDDIDSSNGKGSMLVTLVSRLGEKNIVPFASYASTFTDRESYAREMERQKLGKDRDEALPYAARTTQRSSLELRKILAPFISADGRQRLDITKPEDNTVVLFSNAQIPNEYDTPTRVEDLMPLAQTVLGKEGVGFVGLEEVAKESAA